MNINLKDIDSLLRILDKDTYGLQCQQLINDHKITKKTIVKAKNMGYVQFYNESTHSTVDFISDTYYCRITEEGSRTLNRYGGFENILKYDRASRRVSYAALTIAIISLVASIVMSILK